MEIVVLRNTNSDSGKYFDFNNEFRLKFLKRNIQNVHVHCWPTQTEGVKRVQSRASESSVPPPALWFSIIIVSRCVAGWCQQLVSSLPLLGGSSWLMCSWRLLMMDPLCVCVCVVLLCVQTGVPGFLTDMQKACSNYSSYCQKKWTQPRRRLTHKGSILFFISGRYFWRCIITFFFCMGCVYVAWCGLLPVVVACCWLRHDEHDRPSLIEAGVKSILFHCAVLTNTVLSFLCNQSI